jgi:hypothetical protein
MPQHITFLCYCADKGKRELVNTVLEHEEAIVGKMKCEFDRRKL